MTPQPQPHPSGHRRRRTRFAAIIAVAAAAVAAAELVRRAPGDQADGEVRPAGPALPAFDPGFATVSAWEMARTPEAVRFDSPIGSEHGALTRRVLAPPGDDSTDLPSGWEAWIPLASGDASRGNEDGTVTVFAAADGLVVFAGSARPAPGMAVTLAHRVPRHLHAAGWAQTVYAGLRSIKVAPGSRVARGQPIGTIRPSGRREAGPAEQPRATREIPFRWAVRGTRRVGPSRQGPPASGGGTVVPSPSEVLLRWRGAPEGQLNRSPAALSDGGDSDPTSQTGTRIQWPEPGSPQAPPR